MIDYYLSGKQALFIWHLAALSRERERQLPPAQTFTEKMHGQKRAEYKARLLHPDTRVKLGGKAQQWNHLSDELLKQRRRLFCPPPPLVKHNNVGAEDSSANDVDAAVSAARPSPEVLLALTEKMLSVNPDPSHLWNIRREVLIYLILSSPTDTADNSDTKEIYDEGESAHNFILDIQVELKLTAHCLQRNPKSYSAWFHRKWALAYVMRCSRSNNHWVNMKSILSSELELCGQFLQLDERNFHCWNFRRFVVGLLGSCGGGSCSSVIATDDNEDKENKDKDATIMMSAVDIFSGAWSSWVHQVENGDGSNNEVWMMGPQMSQNSCSAVGMIPSSSDKSDDGIKETGNCGTNKAMPTNVLYKEELEKIIMNEWDFTTSKIQDNFSNGSAFHYRSKLLPLVLEFRSGQSIPSLGKCNAYGAICLVRDEWDGILVDAIFTEPDDQTIWFYHRFVVSWARRYLAGDVKEGVSEKFEELLHDMVDSIQDLIDVEKEDSLEYNDSDRSRHESKGAKCKWAYLGMHLVLSTLLELKSSDEEEKLELYERARGCLSELMTIDPDRRERYQIMDLELKRY